nr:FtsX-like permease family protein [Motilibacter aurantiacus]
MSWNGFLDRWRLFVGAVVTVCLGVALIQSSLLLLVTAVRLDAPPGATALQRMRFDQGAATAVALLGVTLGFAAFLAVFIIGSTFAFTIDQRRRDLALLRLVGGGRAHVRRLLLGEAALLGGAGALLGVLAGVGVMALQTRLLRHLRFVPEGFRGEWHPWAAGASFAAGLALALSGVLLAARRAARVQPLDALRDIEGAARVMTRGRWAVGLLLLLGAAVLAALSPVGGAVGGQAMAQTVSLCAALAATLLGPWLVPAVARLLPVRMGGVLGELSRAALRDEPRRTASTAAPLIVLVGLVLGQGVASASFTDAGRDELARTTRADLVVEGTGPVGAGVAAVPGVAVASTELELPVALTTGTGDAAYTRTLSAVVVDPAGYVDVHEGAGRLDALAGRAVVRGPGADGFGRGDRVGVRVGDEDLGRLPVAATVPQSIGGGAALLLPPGLVPDRLLAEASARTFVRLAPGADRADVARVLASAGAVHDIDDWLGRDAESRQDTSNGVLLVVMGLGALYAAIGVVNAVVIGAGSRGREFAAARATGLTRRQVVVVALAESLTVTGAAVLLGALAAAGTLLAVAAVTGVVTGVASASVPWTLATSVVLGAFALTACSSLLTTWSATRTPPVALLAARE